MFPAREKEWIGSRNGFAMERAKPAKTNYGSECITWAVLRTAAWAHDKYYFRAGRELKAERWTGVTLRTPALHIFNPVKINVFRNTLCVGTYVFMYVQAYFLSSSLKGYRVRKIQYGILERLYFHCVRVRGLSISPRKTASWTVSRNSLEIMLYSGLLSPGTYVHQGEMLSDSSQNPGA